MKIVKDPFKFDSGARKGEKRKCRLIFGYINKVQRK
jgi:hypothetical protein